MPHVLGAPVEGVTLHRLWETSLGDPLYLRELVLAGQETGRLALTKGVWHLSGAVPMGGWLSRHEVSRLLRA